MLAAEHRGESAAVAYFAGESHLDLPPLVDLFSQLESLVACSRCSGNPVRLMTVPPKPRYLPSQQYDPTEDGG